MLTGILCGCTLSGKMRADMDLSRNDNCHYFVHFGENNRIICSAYDSFYLEQQFYSILTSILSWGGIISLLLDFLDGKGDGYVTF